MGARRRRPTAGKPGRARDGHSPAAVVAGRGPRVAPAVALVPLLPGLGGVPHAPAVLALLVPARGGKREGRGTAAAA
eukprot:2834696-Alexandrium_andersonii.AAC.1